jgi:FKBP-type peptidyl-prolyl cis-trans isomerase 2
MTQAQEGNKVQVHYTGKLEDGTVFDSSEGKAPLEFTLGEHQVIPGFEKGVVGMNEGENRTVNIPPDEGYGQRRDDLVIEVQKDSMPENVEPKEGMQLELQTAQGQRVPVVVSEIKGDTVELDANHALAGKELTFDIELVSVE